MLTNKRRPRKSQLYSVEACRVRIIIESYRAKGLGWEDICRELHQRWRINVEEVKVRNQVLNLPPSSKMPSAPTPNSSEPSKVSNVESASTISSSLHRP